MSNADAMPENDLRRAVIRTVQDAEVLHAQVLRGADRTVAWLRNFSGSPLELLTALRFQTVGHDPLTGEPLNVIEQLNQTFTILVSLRAVARLIEMHPEASGFRLALATSSGRDIESVEPSLVAAEVFSATHPGSNQKLKKDIERLALDPARHRYVFFAAPNYPSGRQAHLETVPGIEVHCVQL
jgi:hypothetical protein